MPAPKARVRLVDVANRAGVSLSAASVALNDRPGVSDETRKKVLAAAAKLGYIPDSGAAAMRSGRTRTIGWVSPGVLHGALAGAAEAAHEGGNFLVVLEPEHLGLLQTRGADGIIASGSPKAAAAWAKAGRPVVVVGGGRVPKGAARVGTDPVAATTLAVEHLVGLGHKRIVLVADPEGRDLAAAFEAACASAKATGSVVAPAEAAAALKGRGKRPAVVAERVEDALAAIAPDVPVVALEGGAIAAAAGLTTAAADPGALGRAAVDAVLQLANEEVADVSLAPTLVVGRSTGA